MRTIHSGVLISFTSTPGGQEADVEHLVVAEDLAATLTNIDFVCGLRVSASSSWQPEIRQLTSSLTHVGCPRITDVRVVGPYYDLGSSGVGFRAQVLVYGRDRPCKMIVPATSKPRQNGEGSDERCRRTEGSSSARLPSSSCGSTLPRPSQQERSSPRRTVLPADARSRSSAALAQESCDGWRAALSGCRRPPDGSPADVV